jgi:hypothetical protein
MLIGEWGFALHLYLPLCSVVEMRPVKGVHKLPPVNIFCDALLVLVAGQGRGEHHSQKPL